MIIVRDVIFKSVVRAPTVYSPIRSEDYFSIGEHDLDTICPAQTNLTHQIKLLDTHD